MKEKEIEEIFELKPNVQDLESEKNNDSTDYSKYSISVFIVGLFVSVIVFFVMLENEPAGSWVWGMGALLLSALIFIVSWVISFILSIIAHNKGENGIVTKVSIILNVLPLLLIMGFILSTK